MTEDGKIKSVLFVCTGNSCRSQMAEGYLKKILADLGKTNIEVTSAGLAAYEGSPPTSQAIEVVKRFGADISDNRSKPVTEELVENADIIFAMTTSHQSELYRRFPKSQQKVYLLREFEENHNPKDPDIFDPIGLPIEAYENCFEIMKKPIERVADML
ncbi:MAG: low molecular weight protein arginine phosphatase [Candidatus Aureabacteria bacterium]|nr:low molecular weight protein arginine phosphatase [Candidatus Auribacterota bacterium]